MKNNDVHLWGQKFINVHHAKHWMNEWRWWAGQIRNRIRRLLTTKSEAAALGQNGGSANAPEAQDPSTRGLWWLLLCRQSVIHSLSQPAPTNIAVQHKEAPLAKSSLSLNLWNNRRVALILWYPTWNYSRCALKSSSSASYYAGVDRLIGGRYWRKEEQKRALNLQQLQIRSHESHLKEGIDNNFSKFVR